MSINTPDPVITVYGQPGCAQCGTMKLHLKTKNIPFEYVDVTEDEKGLKWIQDMGYQGVPVTRIGFRHFQGFDPDQVKEALDQLP